MSTRSERWIFVLCLLLACSMALSKRVNSEVKKKNDKSKSKSSIKDTKPKIKQKKGLKKKSKNNSPDSLYSNEIGVFSNGDIDWNDNEEIKENVIDVVEEDDDEDTMDDYLPKITIGLEPSENYADTGVEYAMKGEYLEALQQFWAASHFSTFDSGIWYNLALTISNYVTMEEEKINNKLLTKKNNDKDINEKNKRKSLELHALICEGIYAREIALLLKYNDNEGIIGPSLSKLISKYGGEQTCEEEKKIHNKNNKHQDNVDNDDNDDNDENVRITSKEALEMSLTDSQKAAKLYCQSENDVMMKITKQIKSRIIFPASFIFKYLTKMYVCGVVGLSNIYDEKFIDLLQNQHLIDYNPNLLKGHLETSKIAYRGGKRYEIRFPLEKPYINSELTLNHQLLSLIKGAVGSNQIELDTFSHVDAMPKATYQAWHRDIDPLFKNQLQGELKHHPPMGVVVIVPIINIDKINGPTEFIPGSHVNLPWNQLNNNENNVVSKKKNGKNKKSKNKKGSQAVENDVQSNIMIESKKGDCIIFDLRIKHRGTPNKSEVVRPIIYLSYVNAWYRDAVNFKGKQTNKWSNEFQTTAERKLFMRLDQQRYIENLELALIERGVNIKEFQSDIDYTASMMKV